MWDCSLEGELFLAAVWIARKSILEYVPLLGGSGRKYVYMLKKNSAKELSKGTGKTQCRNPELEVSHAMNMQSTD